MKHQKTLITPDELQIMKAAKNDLKLVDASMINPMTKPNAMDIYNTVRIHDAVFFDIDDIADPNASLPHTLPAEDVFNEKVGALGISSNDTIVIYDQSGISFAAARAWWMFRTFGHENIYVLNGGLRAWMDAGYSLRNEPPTPPQRTEYKAKYRPSLYADMKAVKKAINDEKALILDARDTQRFSAAHIPTSENLFFGKCLNENGCMKPADDLKPLFDGIGADQSIITSCGSGVTACVLALALDESGFDHVSVYDGSWSEWSLPMHQNPVAKS